MKNDVVGVEIRGILPANSGCAIFVGNEEKVFVIQVEHNMGAIIGMFLSTPELPSLWLIAKATIGIWLLAGAAFAVNSIIERHIELRGHDDALERWPLPAVARI